MLAGSGEAEPEGATGAGEAVAPPAEAVGPRGPMVGAPESSMVLLTDHLDPSNRE
jgi:hypothetical protein